MGEDKRGKGKPRAFKDEEEFIGKFNKYIKYCNDSKRFANIAGFCAYNRIVRDTFYACKNYYPDTYTVVNDTLEDESLQHTDYRAIIYLKNKHGYKDKQEVESLNRNENVNIHIEIEALAKDRKALAKLIKRAELPEYIKGSKN